VQFELGEKFGTGRCQRQEQSSAMALSFLGMKNKEEEYQW
jgi:hypothetical protein